MVELAAQNAEVEALLAARVQALRAARNLTLDALAESSGVSRAMLSRIVVGSLGACAYS